MKPITYKGFKIVQLPDGRFEIYTSEEWAMGKGYRYAEFDTGTIEEAKDFIDCY